MAKKPALPAGRIPRGNSVDELRTLVLRRSLLVAKKRAADEAMEFAITCATKARDEKVRSTIEEISAVDQLLKTLLTSRKKSLWRRFGKTIELPGGVIRYRIDAKSLDTPKDTSALIEFLMSIRGGRRYLVIKPQLNRDVITHANMTLLTRLKHLGVRVVRHEIITIKSVGEEKSTTLIRRPYRIHNQ